MKVENDIVTLSRNEMLFYIIDALTLGFLFGFLTFL